ncbi:MAG: putative SprT family Zn-dependent metalloprotease [Halieaceae bacterium]
MGKFSSGACSAQKLLRAAEARLLAERYNSCLPGWRNDTLTRSEIRGIVEQELQRALSRYPKWVHPYTGLEFNRARRTFGQAHRDGRVVLSDRFVGTAALTDLIDTVRHELAHLIAGIPAKHGPRWKAVAVALGAVPRASGRSVDAHLQQRMSDAPFTLIAEMRSGEELEIRKVFRRSRRYLDYRYGTKGQRYHIKGDWVERFHYVDHRQR